MARSIDQTWQQQALSACIALTEDDPQNLDNLDRINAYLATMIGLAHPPNCPSDYLAQAEQLNLDASWGPVATATHKLLGKLSGHPTVEHYYTA